MDFLLLGSFVGGLGLFLLGMRMMIEGLKLSAGPALRHILGHWTRTPMRGVLAGVLITSLVQSSGAVTVAIIGFVNAGLLSLVQSIGVIYGANIGATSTSWLIALIGFKINLNAFALPFIGLGVILSLTGSQTRRAAIGDALVGFGLFFLGLDVLKTAFGSAGGELPLGNLGSGGIDTLLIFVGIGFVLTVLMQSSSASIALILTATVGGMLSLAMAAAAIIGANIGTTSTAAMAALGATPNARRVAAAHVLFNVLEAVVALLILPVMLKGVEMFAHILPLQDSPAITLALFHTVSKLVGLTVIWPLTPRLVKFLGQRFVSSREVLGEPRYLDRNVLATPALAIDAMSLELARIGGIARDMAARPLQAEHRVGKERMAADKQAIVNLVEAVVQFAVQMQRGTLPVEFDQSLPNALGVARYYVSIADIAVHVSKVQERTGVLRDEPLLSEVSFFHADTLDLLQAANPQKTDYEPYEIERRLAAMEDAYQSLKRNLLRAGSEGRIRTEQMVALLDFYSGIRRQLQQVVKAASALYILLGLATEAEQSAEKETDKPAEKIGEEIEESLPAEIL